MKRAYFPIKNWDAFEIPFVGDCVRDEERAVKMAEIILMIDIKNKDSRRQFYPTRVFYDTEDMIWIVSFSPYVDGLLIPGDRENVAFRKDSAEVIKKWAD